MVKLTNSQNQVNEILNDVSFLPNDILTNSPVLLATLIHEASDVVNHEVAAVESNTQIYKLFTLDDSQSERKW